MMDPVTAIVLVFATGCILLALALDHVSASSVEERYGSATTEPEAPTTQVLEMEFEQEKTYIWGVPDDWTEAVIDEFLDVLDPAVPGQHVGLNTNVESSDGTLVHEITQEEMERLQARLEDE